MTCNGSHSSMPVSLYVIDTRPIGRRRRAWSFLPNSQQIDGKRAADAVLLFESTINAVLQKTRILKISKFTDIVWYSAYVAFEGKCEHPGAVPLSTF